MNDYQKETMARVRRSYARLGKLLDTPHPIEAVVAIEAATLFDCLGRLYGPQVWHELGRMQIRRAQMVGGWCAWHSNNPGEVDRVVSGDVCCAACRDSDDAQEKEQVP